MPSFHIVSEIDLQEVDNAVNQAQKEMQNRYDFRGSNSKYEWDKKTLQFLADDNYKLEAMQEILHKKLGRRGVDIMSLKYGAIEPTSNRMLKQTGEFIQGIDKEAAKKIIKFIKDSNLKVQAQIEDEKIKVSSKSIDSLQETISLLKSKDQGLPLQFNNMRS